MKKVGDAIWRVPGNGPNGGEGYTVRKQPFGGHVHDRADGARIRGSQCWSLTANTLTVRVKLEAGAFFEGYRSVPRSWAQSAIVGDALVCFMSGDGAASYQPTSITAGLTTCPGDQQARVARGEFWPAGIPFELY